MNEKAKKTLKMVCRQKCCKRKRRQRGRGKKIQKLIRLGKFAGDQFLSSTYRKNALDWAVSRRNQITR